MGWAIDHEDLQAACRQSLEQIRRIVESKETEDARDRQIFLLVRDLLQSHLLVADAFMRAHRQLSGVRNSHPLYLELFTRLVKWELERLERET